MLGTVLGPFRVLSELGSGGMGTVYAASVEVGTLDLAVGDRVALKVIHPHLLGRQGFFKRFLREAEIGKQVQHRNVVRTLDVDALEVEGETAHFLVMEYVEGRTLRDLVIECGRVPEALVREIALQVSAGLSAIHEAGIVHRDLKPENILITPEHEVRIMDLGVARIIDETVGLTLDGQFAGSLHYAAPEQFRSQVVGPPADLYSLGVLLYELAAGRNPFDLDEAAGIVNAHLQSIPERLDSVCPDVSPFFTHVVGTLLEKEAGKRVTSAAALAELIRNGEHSEWWARQEPTVIREFVHTPKIPVRRGSTFRGREEELQALRAAWKDARSGSGRFILMEGEAGIGKTRLVDAFLQGIGAEKANVLYGSYPPSGGLGALSDAVLDHFGTAGLSNSIRPYLTTTPRLATSFAAMVQHEAPPAGGEPVKGDALHSVFVQIMRGLAAECPLLWVVDDLHFADPDSRGIVLSLARALADRSVLLLATTRPGLPEGEVAHLSRLPDFGRMRLGRLGPREVIELLKDIFKSTALAEKLGGKIAYKSDGVPFFIFEMVRDLMESELVSRLPDGSCVETQVIDEIEVPSAVRDLIDARLRGLTRDERAALDIGAVQGFEFDPDLVARVRRQHLIPVLETLADIERTSGVVRGAGPHYRFDHHQIQEILYEQVHQGLREEYHRALADALAEREGVTVPGTDPSGETAFFLTSHRLKGSQPVDCLPFLLPALRHLRDAIRTEASVSLASAALAEGDLLRGEERFEILKMMVDDLRPLGRRREEKEAIEELLELGASTGEPRLLAHAERGMGMYCLGTGDPVAAQVHIERAVELARGAGARSVEAGALDMLGSVCRVRGRLEDSCAHHESAIGISREDGDRQYEAIGKLNLCAALRELGRTEAALLTAEESLVLAREAGSEGVVGAVEGQLALIYLSQGRLDDAKASAGEYLRICRETGNRRGEAFAAGNLGGILLGVGEYEEARDQFERHLHLARELGDLSSEAIACVNLGELYLSLGDVEEARSFLTASADLAEETGDPRVSAYAVFGLGVAAARSEDPAEAHRLLNQSLEIRRSISYSKGIAEALLELGELNTEEGRETEARSQLQEALDRGRELDSPDIVVLAACRLLSLGDEPEEAVRLYVHHRLNLGRSTRMAACYHLWDSTGDAVHLEAASLDLEFLVNHAPASHQASMIEKVPLHRRIRGARLDEG